MTPIIDPRNGDIEDDASSTKRRSLLSLLGSLLAEISLPKLAIAWMLLIGLPGLLLGAAPLVISIWIASVIAKVANIYAEFLPALLLLPLAAFGWFAGRPLLRLAENSFWSLNALAVQPVYIAFREGLRHLAERLLGHRTSEDRRATVRAVTAAVSGFAMCGLGIGLVVLVWPATRWVGNTSDLASPLRLTPVVLANSVVMISGYFAAAALIWGSADATMAQPRDFRAYAAGSGDDRQWRVAHLSDIHTVGERYGFRIESGRSGPRGNERLSRTLALLDEIHAAKALDVILITGDLTDAGRSAEWAEFFAALAAFPRLAELVVALPGNHDVNVVDRANPARMDLPMSPSKRLRQVRTISALGMLQGTRLRVVDTENGRIGGTLAEVLTPHAADMAAFADKGSLHLSRTLAALWTTIFPLVQPPDTHDGLGIIVLNSNAETHFSFTNALGLVSAEQARAFRIAVKQYPRACWIVALHHHVIEYPQPARELSERIGTALINGSWFIRRLQHLAGRAVIMHGHRHIDWIGACGRLQIVSAPSPVMGATDRQETYFYVHTFAIGADRRLRLLEPERISVRDRQAADAART
ncbi:MAG TPA: metallophosphoesterase [Acetobacteraceae bacterium]